MGNKKLKKIKKTLAKRVKKPSIIDPRSKEMTQNKTVVVNQDQDNIDKELYYGLPNMFENYNEAIKPPYKILIDTNFIQFAVKNKISLKKGFDNCLISCVEPMVPECVLGELEKLGRKYRLALRSVQSDYVKKLKCYHKGTYADDCIFDRVRRNNVYIVATSDKLLQGRIIKIPGVPIMYVAKKKFAIRNFAMD
eukprot:GAHX01001507.1.p1 GENE.GAHX01001507.1~~GAHX01001507.1.p1  ORF type:complete len:194 (+),score=30.86 GAHX01001507.1:35-616(+)